MRRVVALGLALADSASARVVTGSATLTGEFTEHDVCKFAYRIGRGNYRLDVWLDAGQEYASDELKAYAYLDDDWDAVTRATTCDEKVKLARWSSPVALRSSAKAGPDGVPPPDVPGWTHSRGISSSIRTHVWYFTLADCSLERYLHPVPLLHYRAELKDGDSHLPVDEAGLKPLHRLNAFLAFSLALWLLGRAKRTAAGKGKGATVHAAEVALFVAAFCDAASSACELAHMSRYERNGVGSYLFDAWSAYLEATSDAVLALLALCIAGGWTLSSRLGDDEKAGRDPLRDETPFEKYASAAAPLAAALRAPFRDRPLAAACAGGFVGLHVALAQWSRVYDDDFESFHDFEHPPGRVVVGLRVVLALTFVPVALRTQACAGARLKRFYAWWCAVGLAWFASLPVVTAIAAVCPAYARHRVVQGCCGLIQTAALGGFAVLFAGKTARVFHDASTVGDGASDLGLGGGGAPAGPKLRFAGMKVRVD